MTDEKRLKEFREKRQRIAGILKSRALEGLYLKRQDNFAWATAGGTNTVGVTGDPGVAGLLFTSRGDFVLCSNIEAPRMQEEEALEDFGFKIHTWVWLENREKQILQEILDGGALGADFALAGAENLAAEIASLRYSLTEDEADRYRQLGYDVSLALETAAAGIRPGDRECEVTGRLASMLWNNRIDIVTTFCAADERIEKYRHPVTTKKTISQRAMLGVNARRGGLIVCLTRFVQFGGVPEKLARQYRDNVEIDNVFISQTRTGRPVVEVLEAGVEAYRRLGYPGEYQLHHQGGAIGYRGRDYRVDFSCAEIVQNRQPFCWNPSISGTKSEDTIMAQAGSPEPVTRPVLFPVMNMEVNGISFRRADILKL